LSISAYFQNDFQSNETKPRNPDLKEPGDDLLNIIFKNGDGINDDSMTFLGTLTQLNSALKHLSYKGKTNFNGEDQISITCTDNGVGKSMAENAGVNVNTITVRVAAINDPPVITVPIFEGHTTQFRLLEDLELRITGAKYHGKPHVPSRYVYQSGYELFRGEGSRPDADWPYWRGRLVADIYPGKSPSSPRYFQVYKNALYFSADDGVHGRELWRTSHDFVQQDQFATELVKDIFPGSRGSNPTWIITMGNTLYFASNGVDTTWMNFDDSCSGFRQSSIDPSIRYAISNSTIWNPDYVYDCPSGYHWADTEEGLAMVETGNQGSHPGGTTHLRGKTSYYNQCGWNGYYFGGKKRRLFRFSDSHITGAYKSAGTQEDAELIVTNFETSEFAGIVCVRGLDDEDNDNSRCRKQEVKDTARMPGLPVRPCYIRGGNELWRTDSTENGTYRLADIRAGVGSSNPEFLVAHEPSGTLFFAATKDPQGRELFVSDGTQEGTQLVEDIYYGAGGSNPKHITIRNETDSTPLVFFQARDKQRGEELWLSDGVVGNFGDGAAGSGSGTKLVKDIYPGAFGSRPHSLLMLGDLLIFFANDGVHGDELWSSRGTGESTTLVRDIWPGAHGSSDGEASAQLTLYRDSAFFKASDGEWGHEIWRTDGTFGGTYMLKDLCVGFCSSNPNFFTRFKPPTANGVEELYFTANMGKDGAELWVSDGTLARTRRAFEHTDADIDIDEESHHLDFPTELGVYHGSLYWGGNEGRADIELPRGGVGTKEDEFLAGLDAAIVVEDVDVGNGQFVVSLSCRKGEITIASFDGLTFIEGDGTKDRSMKFTANQLDVNEAFRYLQYRALPNENGEDYISIIVNDTALSGDYDVWEESSNSIRIWIEETNDAPTIERAAHNPEKYFAKGTGTGIAQEGGPFTNTATLGVMSIIDGFVINDVDMAPHDHIRVEIEVMYGRLTLNSINDLSFGGARGQGTGIKDRIMSFSGTLKNVNIALYRLRYLCTENDGCIDDESGEKIVIRVRDIDTSGRLETLTAMKTIEVNVVQPNTNIK